MSGGGDIPQQSQKINDSGIASERAESFSRTPRPGFCPSYIMNELGRGDEGVKTARRGWDISSPLGKMFIHMVEVCANATTNKPAAEKALNLLRKEQAENYPAMTAALLCMDRTNEAADLIKKRLSLPSERASVLTAVQTYHLPPFVTPMRRQLRERYAKIIARPDIQAAINKHGRVETFPYVAKYWGNF